MGTYTIKNLRILRSGAYEATLHRGRTRVALVEDDGRGGQPYLTWLNPDGTAIPNRDTEELYADLTRWGDSNIAAGFFTGWWAGLDRLDNDWELTLAYLVEAAELNKASRQRDLYRRPDGNFYTKPREVVLPADATHVWHDGAWQPVPV